MSQFILKLKDESKLEQLLSYLHSLSYISIEKLSGDPIIISEEDKNLMRERKKNAKLEDFKDWDDIKDSFKVD